MKAILGLIVLMHLCARGMTMPSEFIEDAPEMFDDEPLEEFYGEPTIEEDQLDDDFEDFEDEFEESENDDILEDADLNEDVDLLEAGETEDAEWMEDEEIPEADFTFRGPFHDDVCKYATFESGHEVRLHPSASVVKNAFATGDFSAGVPLRWDDAIIPMLGQVYKLHHVLEDRVALTPPGGGHGQSYFFFPFAAFITGFKVGGSVRLHFDRNVVETSFKGLTNYRWDDAIIPMLGNKFTVVEMRGSMIGVKSPDGRTFYFPIGALVKEECYKDCGTHGSLNDNKCICASGWTGELCNIGGGSCEYLGFTAGAAVKLNPSADVVKNAFATTHFTGSPQIRWDDAIIPMLGKVYKLHNVLEDRVALVPPGGDHGQSYFYFPFKAFVSEFQVGVHVRLSNDKNVVKNSFSGLTAYVWSDAIIPMLGKQYVIKEVRGAMLGIEAPSGGQLFYFPVGALIPEHCYKDCKHGRLDTGKCICDAGWTGELCDKKACSPSCKNGKCVDGKCKCNDGWGGNDCGTKLCRPSCVHGTCHNGVCKCDAGWTGKDCNTKLCNPTCVHGTCDNGVCKCNKGYTGKSCSERLCNPKCVHGVCNDGVCKCSSGWTGAACDQAVCNPACEHGKCVNGKCVCDKGWTGSNCNERLCNPKCIHGVCNNGVCKCHSGWTGADCGTKVCNPSCVHGTCVDGKCKCNSGYTGAACNEKLCNPKCINGVCNDGVCKCHSGWTGADCGTKVCNPSCVRGSCVDGKCKCPSGWGGNDCNTKLCNPSCVRGSCVDGVCKCPSGWGGNDCNTKLCNPSCVRGSCVDGKCKCPSGWGGNDCNTKLCNPSCVRGSCVDGKCKCPSGWGGNDCNTKLCNPSCVRGSCVDGKCKCPSGYGGNDCNTKLCNPSCVRGSCVDGKCKCPSGYGGNDCNTKLCNPSCVRGSCVDGKCKCPSGYGGNDCNTKLCDPSCKHGKCVAGKCQCPAGYGGNDCGTKLCNPKCVNGKCHDGKCVCSKGWVGAACSEEACVDTLSHKQCNSYKMYCGQIKDGGPQQNFMKNKCCAYCKNVKCTNDGTQTEAQCIKKLGSCKAMGPWMDLKCCATCEKYLGKCLDTKAVVCANYRGDLYKIKTDTYTGEKHHKEYLQLHCCDSIKNAKAAACVNKAGLAQCGWKKYLQRHCPSDPYIKKNCCAACKAILG